MRQRPKRSGASTSNKSSERVAALRRCHRRASAHSQSQLASAVRTTPRRSAPQTPLRCSTHDPVRSQARIPATRRSHTRTTQRLSDSALRSSCSWSQLWQAKRRPTRRRRPPPPPAASMHRSQRRRSTSRSAEVSTLATRYIAHRNRASTATLSYRLSADASCAANSVRRRHRSLGNHNNRAIF